MKPLLLQTQMQQNELFHSFKFAFSDFLINQKNFWPFPCKKNLLPTTSLPKRSNFNIVKFRYTKANCIFYRLRYIEVLIFTELGENSNEKAFM